MTFLCQPFSLHIQAQATDALTQAILERLNDEVSKLYVQASQQSNADGGEGGVGPNLGQDGSAAEGMMMSASGLLGSGGASTVHMPKGPTPADLWRAAHEVPQQPKERVMLTDEAWQDLVNRLNESSKKKEVFLLKAQRKQLADQLAGLTFTPAISQRSRVIAEKNENLQDRVAALMRKKKAKIERIRNEKLQKEQEDAPFRPNLNKPRTQADGAVRRVGHLMQYEIDRRLRAEQRRMIIEEKESQELTFKPVINANSGRIVARLQEEKAMEAALSSSGGNAFPPSPAIASMLPAPPTSTRIKKKELVDALAEYHKKVETRPGNSFLPGHEEETFRPVINQRSKLLHRPGVDDVDVYTRLYAASNSANGSSKAGGSSPARGSRTTFTLDSAPIGKSGGGGGGDVDGEEGDAEIGPGHPKYFSAVPYDSSKMQFIVKKVTSFN